MAAAMIKHGGAVIGDAVAGDGTTVVAEDGSQLAVDGFLATRDSLAAEEARTCVKMGVFSRQVGCGFGAMSGSADNRLGKKNKKAHQLRSHANNIGLGVILSEFSGHFHDHSTLCMLCCLHSVKTDTVMHSYELLMTSTCSMILLVL